MQRVVGDGGMVEVAAAVGITGITGIMAGPTAVALVGVEAVMVTDIAMEVAVAGGPHHINRAVPVAHSPTVR